MSIQIFFTEDSCTVTCFRVEILATDDIPNDVLEVCAINTRGRAI